MGPRLSILVGIAAAAVAAAPAQAERIRTYWRLEPVVADPPSQVPFGATFFEQRLLPVRLVELTSPLATGGETLARGTLLYLVFNDSGRIGYCTIASATTGGPSKLFSIPILNQRPCLVDSDGDGTFDKLFSVYQKYGGPPTSRGSINGATPLPATAGYRSVDARKYPADLRVSFRLKGKADPAKARVGVKFSRDLGETWPTQKGTPSGGATLFSLLNAEIRLLGVQGGSAKLDIRWADDVYLWTDNSNTLIWGPLPGFVPRN